MTLLSSTAATWQQLFGLDRILFGFLLLSSSSVFLSGFSSGRTFFKSPNNAKPCPLDRNAFGQEFPQAQFFFSQNLFCSRSSSISFMFVV
jgi:hypothetical protein